MSLFRPLTQSVLVDNLSFTKDSQVRCSQHQEEPSKLYFRRGLFGNTQPFAACPRCIMQNDLNATCPTSFQADSVKQCYVVSPTLSKCSLSFEQAKVDPALELQHRVFEHLLWDTQSNGYGLRSLVYMRDQKVLATCSKNGSICFWSIGDTIELKGPKLNLEKNIHFAKYCAISEEKKYFIVGTGRGVHIYNMAEGAIKLFGVIDEDKIVKDLEFIIEENKFLTIYSESLVKVWNLDSLEMEETIDLQKYNIKGEIHTVIFMKRTKELAIEHEKGLSVIDWQSRGDNFVKIKVRHLIVADKKTFGCIHLPESKRFILNNSAQNIQILKEEDLSEEKRHEASRSLFGPPPPFPMKFASTRDESQIISNCSGRRVYIYDGKSFQTHCFESFIWQLADVEIMEDQYRIAIADKDRGGIYIYRVNSNMKIQRTQGWPQDYFMPSINGDPLNSAEMRNLPVSGRQPQPLNINSYNRPLFTPVNFGRKNVKTAIVSRPKQVTTKASAKGKKIKKVQISVKKKSSAVKRDVKKKTAVKKDIKKKSKVLTVVKPSKTLKKKQVKAKEEDSPVEIVRIRTKKGGKTPKKEEKVWVVFSSESEFESEKEEKKISKEKRGRSSEKRNSSTKKAGKRKVDGSEERSRSRSNSKSVTRRR